MKRFVQRFISLHTGHTTITTNNHEKYIYRQQYLYEPNSKFVYQFGHVNNLIHYKEEKNEYLLANNNQLPLKDTHFVGTALAYQTVFEKFIKNNSRVRFLYFKVLNKEFIMIQSLNDD
jgi:hypothetical protein